MKAAKQLTITIRNYIFEKYLQHVGKNRSAFFEEMFVLGCEVSNSEELNIKKVYELQQTIKAKDTEIMLLKRELSKKKDKNCNIPIQVDYTKINAFWKETIPLLKQNPQYLDGRYKLYRLNFDCEITRSQFIDLYNKKMGNLK